MKWLELLLVTAITFVIGFGLPALIYFAVRRGNTMRDLEVLRRAMQAQQKMGKPNQDMEELSRRVADLKKTRWEDEEKD